MKCLTLLTFFLYSLTTLGSPSKINDAIQKGDTLYSLRKDMNNVFKARDLFWQAYESHPNNPMLLWRLSMVDYYIGHLAFEKKRRIKYFREGVELGNKCIELSKENPMAECYFWLATNRALAKKESGILGLAFNIGDIIKLLEKAKTLKPDYAGAGSYRTLALVYFKAPALFGGNSDKAFRYIKEAIKIKPHEPLNYFFYVKLLLDNGEPEKAMVVATRYLKENKPRKFPYFESNTAYKKLEIFKQTKTMPQSD